MSPFSISGGHSAHDFVVGSMTCKDKQMVLHIEKHKELKLRVMTLMRLGLNPLVALLDREEYILKKR